MITLGIDLSSQPKGTAACQITWPSKGPAQVSEPFVSCDDLRLDELIQQSQVIGIDAPLGWPQAFTAAVRGWEYDQWTNELRDELRFRETDRAVSRFFTSLDVTLSPLSVSTDRISLPAMRAMALLKRHRVTDKSGDGRFYEVYPAGSLKCWGLLRKGYKGGKADALKHRQELLANLRQKLPVITISDDYAKSDHAFDALIAAFTARAAAVGRTRGPDHPQQGAASVEGWIHLPEARGISLDSFT